MSKAQIKDGVRLIQSIVFWVMLSGFVFGAFERSFALSASGSLIDLRNILVALFFMTGVLILCPWLAEWAANWVSKEEN